MIPKVQKGFFLIASPEIDSGIFFRSVVLLCEHKPQGSVGLIINKIVNASLVDDASRHGQVNSPINVCKSGPVHTQQLMLLHDGSIDQSDSLEICEGVFLGGDVEFLHQLIVSAPTPQFKMCLGHTGWGPGQLEHELINDMWFAYPATSSYVFEKPADQLWYHLLRDMGGNYARLSMMPEDLLLN